MRPSRVHRQYSGLYTLPGHVAVNSRTSEVIWCFPHEELPSDEFVLDESSIVNCMVTGRMGLLRPLYYKYIASARSDLVPAIEVRRAVIESRVHEDPGRSQQVDMIVTLFSTNVASSRRVDAYGIALQAAVSVGSFCAALGFWLCFLCVHRQYVLQRRKKLGQCISCGYPRAGLTQQATCPECGRGGTDLESSLTWHRLAESAEQVGADERRA